MGDTYKKSKIPRLTCAPDLFSEDVDRFSNLPEPIIHYIYSYLETIDVIRASAVSRKWRYLWVTIPFLDFNIHTVWRNPQERWSLQTINEKFKDFVNWVLLSQNGSVNIKRLRLWYLNCDYDHTLYRWLNVMTRRNVQELDLNIDSESPIELPHCIVSCESLVALKLNCESRQSVLKLPTHAGFGRLKSLNLKTVQLLDYISFQNFISSCPLLENLNMTDCVFREFKTLEISTASLKYLTIDDMVFRQPRGLRNCDVKIVCSNLHSLNFSVAANLEFSFQELNSLKSVSLDLNIDSEAPIESPHCCVSCKSLVTLKLNLDDCVLKLPAHADFSCLKSLHLENVQLLDYVSFQKFISGCSLLENLNMTNCVFRDFKILEISTISLKFLTIDDLISGEPKGLSNCGVKVACPNLHSLNFLGSANLELSFQEFNSLQSAALELFPETDEESSYDIIKIFNGLCSVEVLKLSHLVLEFLFYAFAKPGSFSTSLNKLKSLELVVCRSDRNFKSVINLLVCAPNLEALTIYFDGVLSDDWEIPDKAISCLTYHLKIVKLLNVDGIEKELRFIRFVLKNGQALQKMNITLVETNVKYRKMIIQHITQFPKLSPTVALAFLEPGTGNDFWMLTYQKEKILDVEYK